MRENCDEMKFKLKNSQNDDEFLDFFFFLNCVTFSSSRRVDE